MSEIAIYDQFSRLTVERQIKAVIGMSREKFDQLVLVFYSSHIAIQQERLENKEIKNIPWGGKDSILNTPEKQLFFTLFYLKTYPTFDVLGFHFGLSAGHARDALIFYMRIVEHSLSSLKTLPARHLESLEEFKQAIDYDKEIIIDGVEVPCVRPGDSVEQKARYSGKKKTYTQGVNHHQ